MRNKSKRNEFNTYTTKINGKPCLEVKLFKGFPIESACEDLIYMAFAAIPGDLIDKLEAIQKVERNVLQRFIEDQEGQEHEHNSH